MTDQIRREIEQLRSEKTKALKMRYRELFGNGAQPGLQRCQHAVSIIRVLHSDDGRRCVCHQVLRLIAEDRAERCAGFAQLVCEDGHKCAAAIGQQGFVPAHPGAPAAGQHESGRLHERIIALAVPGGPGSPALADWRIPVIIG